jgi:translation initiation factor 4H
VRHTPVLLASIPLSCFPSYSNGRAGPPRNHVIPSEPPFTAYIGNAPDTMVQGDFETILFAGLKVKQVRLVRDRQTDRFRGTFT